MFYEQLDDNDITQCLQRCTNRRRTCVKFVITIACVAIGLTGTIWGISDSATNNGIAMFYGSTFGLIAVVIISCWCCSDGAKCPSCISKHCHNLCLPRKKRREHRKLQRAIDEFYYELTEILLNQLFEQCLVKEILSYMDDLEDIEVDGLFLNDRNVIVDFYNINESLLNE